MANWKKTAKLSAISFADRDEDQYSVHNLDK